MKVVILAGGQQSTISNYDKAANSLFIPEKCSLLFKIAFSPKISYTNVSNKKLLIVLGSLNFLNMDAMANCLTVLQKYAGTHQSIKI